jgi:hypothetical protein
MQAAVPAAAYAKEQRDPHQRAAFVKDPRRRSPEQHAVADAGGSAEKDRLEREQCAAYRRAFR